MSQNPFQTQPNSTSQAPPTGNNAYAANKVKGPALGVLISTIVGLLLTLLGIVLNILGLSLIAVADQPAQPEIVSVVGQGIIGLVFNIIALIGGGVIVFGCLKMMKLQSYGFAFTTCILAMIPCISPCCLLGIPFGIWGLVVLNEPRVKNSFR
jgi:hypothetical protein